MAERLDPALPFGQGLLRDRDAWPIVGESGPAPGLWDLEAKGLVARPLRWTLETLRNRPQIERIIDVHCVTRWSKLGVRFSGVMLADLLAESGVRPEGRFLRCVAHSARDHDACLSLNEALEAGALVAFSLEGRPLPTAQGGPVRLVMPEKYYYKSVKWLKILEILDEVRPGFWERTAGYHENANPWREERFQAGTLDPRLRQRLIARRSFAGRELRGADFSGEDLAGLAAQKALLRACRFEGAQLRRADFSGANLSNAVFARADLRGVAFVGADVEGADFSGADLTDADFTGASLFGASFTGGPGAAILAGARLASEQAARLTDEQRDFLTQAMGWR